MPFTLHDVTEFLKHFGLLKGCFVLFFCGAHWIIFRLYGLRVKDCKEQINLIAGENREYRERFLSILDNKFGYQTKLNDPPSVPQKNQKEGGKK